MNNYFIIGKVNEGKSPSEWNIAQKGIAVRLDGGSGGVSKGQSWLIYDEDTMRVAAAYQGEFVDWRGIAFDGSHGTHTSIKGDAVLITPDRPAWRNPSASATEWVGEAIRIGGSADSLSHRAGHREKYLKRQHEYWQRKSRQEPGGTSPQSPEQ